MEDSPMAAPTVVITLQDIDVIAVGYNPFGFIEHGRIPLHPVALAQYIANIFIYESKLKGFAKGVLPILNLLPSLLRVLLMMPNE